MRRVEEEKKLPDSLSGRVYRMHKKHWVQVCFFIPASLLVSFLTSQAYPFWAMESLAFLAVLLLMAVVAVQSKMTRAVWLAFFALVILEQFVSVFELVRIARNEFGLFELKVFYIYACVFLIFFAILIALKERGTQFFLTIASVLLFVSILLNLITCFSPPAFWKTIHPETQGSLEPMVLHVVFDEHAGLDRIPESFPEAIAAKKQIQSFFSRFGFLLFEHAYSRWNSTLDSFPGFLSLGNSQGEQNEQKNILFEELCKEKSVGVILFDHGPLPSLLQRDCVELLGKYIPKLGQITEREVPFQQRALILLNAWSHSNSFFEYISLRLGLDPDFVEYGFGRQPPTWLAKQALEHMRLEVQARRVQVLFVHLYLPHFPYSFGRDMSEQLNAATWYGDQGAWNPANLREREKACYLQLQGLYDWLGAWFLELESSGRLDSLEIIFHGDHGSRFFQPRLTSEPPEGTTPEHWLDNFSTLFAARHPTIEPGQNQQAKPLEQLVRQFYFEPEHLTQPDPQTPFVWLDFKGSPGREKHHFEVWPPQPSEQESVGSGMAENQEPHSDAETEAE